MAVTWNPDQYNRFADTRGRPFFDLVGQVPAGDPARVVDLGCGPGTLTVALADRWPSATVVGIDSSAEMIHAATTDVANHRDNLSFELGDIATWTAGADVDVLVSNAALQWVPAHRDLLRRWAAILRPGAWMAWQVPGNHNAPSHALLHQLTRSARWASQLGSVPRFGSSVDTPSGYAQLLLQAGWSANAWETTYVQLLTGDDPVLEWVRGTTLGPVRALLSEADNAEFESEYAASLRQAYPGGPFGTSFPFRRIFAVGRKD